MLMTRLAFIGTAAIMTSSSPCFQFLCSGGKSSSVTQQYQNPPLVAKYYEPPLPLDYPSGNYNNDGTKMITATHNNDDYYSNNPSVFGKILRGELPARMYLESTDLLAFRDRSPKAPMHALVIPKRYVKSVYSLRSRKIESHDNKEVGEKYDYEEEDDDDDDIRLVQDMRQMGLDLLKQQQPAALAADDFIFCFHIPPFNSVDHLHLHVLAPKSEMNWLYREIKYKCGSKWCTSDLDVIERLEAGLPAVSYKHPFQVDGVIM
ncbi:hypothetical protein ACHAWC_005570 [Mediolabrus comicus]